MKIVTVIGARPQFIKAAVVSKAFELCAELKEVIVHTGQHYDENMSDCFFQELGLADPAYNLNVGSASHGSQTGRMLDLIERVLLAERPDWVLVYGDTNSTVAGALAGAKLQIPVAHVEAGLRAFDRSIPEELNRLVTDHISDLLFAPTEAAVKNLRREGFDESRFHQVGDVMYDAVLHYGSRAEAKSDILRKLSLRRGEYILVTLHRPSNTDNDERLRAILLGLMEVSAACPVVLPLHPRTRRQLIEKGLIEKVSHRIQLCDAVGYLDMVMLERNARLIATDSGGVQKEAYFHRVPCVTFRDTTEWVELVELDWNRLAPPVSPAAVVAGVRDGLNAIPKRAQMLYGDGNAGERIAQTIQNSRS